MKLIKGLICIGIFCLILGSFTYAQEEKLKENWDQFKKVWNEVYEHMTEQKDEQPANPFNLGGGQYKMIKDKELKLYAEVGQLLEKAGLLKSDDDLDEVTYGIKKLFKIGTAKSSGGLGNILVQVAGPGGPGGQRENPAEAYKKLKEALEELKGGDKDSLNDIKKSLKTLKAFKEDTGHFKKQRVLRLIEALVLGQNYPEKPKPSAELEKKIQELVKKLGNENFKERDNAEKELREMGELAESVLKKALNETKDTEVKTRIQRLLGEGEEEEEDEENDEEGRGPQRQVQVEARAVIPGMEPQEDDENGEDEE